eukprot:Skav204330  [mRNA]  locus=scaffold1960:56005:62087:- [translate_table: standard]
MMPLMLLMKAKVVFPPNLAKKKAKVEAEPVQHISSGDDAPKESPRVSKEAAGGPESTKESKEDVKDPEVRAAPVHKRVTTPAPMATPVMQRVEGIVRSHGHDKAFEKETREYVGRLHLNNEVAYILRMLSSTAAWGVMKSCSTESQSWSHGHRSLGVKQHKGTTRVDR